MKKLIGAMLACLMAGSLMAAAPEITNSTGGLKSERGATDLVTDATALVQHLNLVLCAGQISAANQQIMVNALKARTITSSTAASTKLDQIAGAILMVMACPEYLIQK